MTGLLASLSVAWFQQRHRLGSEGLLPVTSGTTTLPRGIGAAAATHAPTLCIVWATLVLTLTHSGPPDELLFALNGTFCAWFYLRYFQPNPQPGLPQGDCSDDFGIVNLFPPPVRPPIRVLSNATYAFTSSCGIFPPAGWGERSDPLGIGCGGNACGGFATSTPSVHVTAGGGHGGAGPSGVELLATPLPPTPSVTTTDPEVAERRRERARALIEARLAAKQTATVGTPQTPGPVTPV